MAQMSSIHPLALAYFILEWTIRFAMLAVVPRARSPDAARGWLLFIAFLPVPGLILYRLIGRPKFPQWRNERFEQTQAMREDVATTLEARGSGNTAFASIANLAASYGDFPPCPDNGFGLSDDYDATIAAMVRDIDRAKVNVRLLTYIFADDHTGRSVAEALGRAVRRGVEVRVLIDSLGSRQWARRSLKMLDDQGVKAHLVLPVRLALFRRTRSDLRNHRKLCLIDGQVGYVGSQNIVDRDFRETIVNTELVARVEGPVVAALDAIFRTDWHLETGDGLAPASAPADDPAASGTSNLQALPSGPDYGVQGLERLLVEMIHRAQHRVCLVSPYFIPDEPMLTAIKIAVDRGVEVDLVFSRIADQVMVGYAQRSYYRELLECGVRIHLYRDGLLHAKNFTIDDALGVIGSGNADLRSFTLNAEISLIVHDRPSAAALASAQRHFIAQSDTLTLEEWTMRPAPGRVVESLTRLFSPLL